MNTIIAEISVIPLGTQSTSLSTYIAAIEKEIRQETKVKSLLTPMSTVLEGEWNDVMDLIHRIHQIPFAMKASRVTTRISIDDRRDKPLTMQEKIKAVKAKLD